MKLYFIAGEASGDMHGANLIKAMRQHDSSIQLRGWGGDRMQSEGLELVKHIRELAFMGFAEVLMNLKTILGNISFCKSDIQAYKPDAVILIDYPGFNLRLAPFLQRQGIQVFYYISPQVWAWKSSRVHDIKKYVDRMYTILPFEQDWYKERGLEVNYVGHPLLDELESVQVQRDKAKQQIALLPGSRKQEISKMLPVMKEAMMHFPEHSYVVAAAPAISDEVYHQILGEDAQIVRGQTYQVIAESRAALVTSGTATLETGLIGTPQVVCYKGSAISYAIAKRLVKLDYISLVNLIMDRPVVKELIQSEMTVGQIVAALKPLLEASESRARMLDDYAELRSILGGPGASDRCAQDMLKSLSSSH